MTGVGFPATMVATYRLVMGRFPSFSAARRTH